MNPRWFGQETETSCVAACARMVLSGFGDVRSESELRDILGNPRLGITLAKAAAELSKAGARVELDWDLNSDDLRDYTRQNIFPIVGIERHLLGFQPASHAVVVLEVSADSVTVFDSLENEQPKRFRRETFEKAWKLAGKEALLVYSRIG